MFQHGVASFDPTSDGVLLWTLVSGGGPARWELAHDESFVEIVQSGDAQPQPAIGTVVVEVTGLEPATSYWYRFTVGTALSPVGRTRTLPAAGATQLRIGVTCCARYSQQQFHVYRALADADVDVVLHVGDYIYEDCKEGMEDRQPEPQHSLVSLSDYSTRHAQHRRDPDLQALHARHPMIAIWDDHDLADNAWAGGAETHDAETQGPWSERLDAALRAHNHFLPKRLTDANDPQTAWRRIDAGDLVSIVCTETRAQRDQQAGLDGASSADDPDRSLLGDAQRCWLGDAVRDRSAAWLVLASGTVVSELEIPTPDVFDRCLPEKYEVIDGRAINSDQWDGYRAERARLADALADRRSPAILLSGDIHSAWAIDGPLGAAGTPVAVELVCPPAATTPLGQILPAGVGSWLGPALRRELPRVRWVDVEHRGFLTLDVGRNRVEACWWWVDAEADDGAEHRSDGERPAPVLGRRWVVPRQWPPSLFDPEPERHIDDEDPGPAPHHVRRRRARWLVAVGAAGAASAWALRRVRR